LANHAENANLPISVEALRLLNQRFFFSPARPRQARRRASAILSPFPSCFAIERNMKKLLNQTLGFFGKRGRPFASRRRQDLTITLEGTLFIVVIMCVGLAAINTGANLLYLFFAAVASLLVLSGMMSRVNLRGIQARRRLPRLCVAGQTARVHLFIHNTKRFQHSYSLRVLDMSTAGAVSGACYCLRVRRKETARLEYGVTFHRRGRQRLEQISVSSLFPFGFLSKRVHTPCPAEILVYPRMYPADEIIKEQILELGLREAPRKGHSASLYALRDYTAQDPARLIHWKASAKLETLVARETEAEDRRRISLILDNSVAAQQRRDLDDAFERAVSCAASTARDLILLGFQVEVLTRSGRIPFDSSPGHLNRILRALALIQLQDDGQSQRGVTAPDEESFPLYFGFGSGAIPDGRWGDVMTIDAASWPHGHDWPQIPSESIS
jgi:uncharacterized protein (DUF58 family)